jgi:hypothetical protein
MISGQGQGDHPGAPRPAGSRPEGAGAAVRLSAVTARGDNPLKVEAVSKFLAAVSGACAVGSRAKLPVAASPRRRRSRTSSRASGSPRPSRKLSTRRQRDGGPNRTRRRRVRPTAGRIPGKWPVPGSELPPEMPTGSTASSSIPNSCSRSSSPYSCAWSRTSPTSTVWPGPCCRVIPSNADSKRSLSRPRRTIRYLPAATVSSRPPDRPAPPNRHAAGPERWPRPR